MLGREVASSRGAVCFSSCCCRLCFLTLWEGEGGSQPPPPKPLCLLGVWSGGAWMSFCVPSAGGALCWDAPHVLGNALLILWCMLSVVSPASISPAVIKRDYYFFFFNCGYFILFLACTFSFC